MSTLLDEVSAAYNMVMHDTVSLGSSRARWSNRTTWASRTRQVQRGWLQVGHLLLVTAFVAGWKFARTCPPEQSPTAVRKYAEHLYALLDPPVRSPSITLPSRQTYRFENGTLYHATRGFTTVWHPCPNTLDELIQDALAKNKYEEARLFLQLAKSKPKPSNENLPVSSA